VREGLNCLSAFPVKNNPIYATLSIAVTNFTPS
jgi:hypothetical protein